MDVAANFVVLDPLHVGFLFAVGFVGGLVSGFIGSGGAFVLTPAMMSMGVPGIVAVASNMCHKFPKALVGAIKRARYGQVDLKLGIVMGVSAEAGVLYGAHLQETVQRTFGEAGSNLYVSAAFVVVLAIVGGYVTWDAYRTLRSGAAQATETVSRLARRVQSIHIPYTMVYFSSLQARVSILFTVPLGFATGLLAATIAVGGFIGVPGMHYVLGAPSLMASATELVIAFVMGLGGTIKYAWSGFVDVRLAMIILAGSLFGIQLGAIGTTYVKPHMIKLVMGTIMLLVLVSRLLVIPVYLSELELIEPLRGDTRKALKGMSFAVLVLALATGALIILRALRAGLRAQRAAEATTAVQAAVAPTPTTVVRQLSPLGRFERFLVSTDRSEFSAGAEREALRLAKRCGAQVRVVTAVASGHEQESMGEQVLRQELDHAQAHLAGIVAQAAAAGVKCETAVLQGTSVEESLLAEADRYDADLIVTGRRSRGRLERAVLGDTSLNLISRAHCGVLIVPPGADLQGRRFLVASDGSRFGDAAAAVACNLAPRFAAPVTVVSVVVPTHAEARRREAPDVVDRLVRFLREAGIDAQGETPIGAAAEAIVSTATRLEADLIIMGSHGRTGLERLVIGSNSAQVLDRTPCAVLVVKSA